MLVSYSSSSSEEEETEGAKGRKRNKPEGFFLKEEKWSQDGQKKKVKTEQNETKFRLPVPGAVVAMFPDQTTSQTEDSALHGGRVRSFKHERGNWATNVYLPCAPDEDFLDRVDELLSLAARHGVDLTAQADFHLSVSQTVVLRHHWIRPFTQSLKHGLNNCRRFVCSAGGLKVYRNAERSRTFLGMEMTVGVVQLLNVVKVVDRTMTDFGLDTFYPDPSFHVSLAWCVGDVTLKMNACITELQRAMDDHQDGPLVLSVDCSELRCRTGNKTFRFSLET